MPENKQPLSHARQRDHTIENSCVLEDKQPLSHGARGQQATSLASPTTRSRGMTIENSRRLRKQRPLSCVRPTSRSSDQDLSRAQGPSLARHPRTTSNFLACPTKQSGGGTSENSHAPGEDRDLSCQIQKMADDEDYYPPLDRDRHSDALGGVENDDNLNMFLNLAGDIEEEEEGVGG